MRGGYDGEIGRFRELCDFRKLREGKVSGFFSGWWSVGVNEGGEEEV